MDKFCSLHSCDRQHYCKGYCELHYRRWKKHGDPSIQIRADRGTGCLDKHGYIRVPNPDGGQTFQHRLVMQEHLGRRLYPDETVHHLNGIRSDNRLANLELWSTLHPKGQRVEDKIKWAKEILKRYPEGGIT